MSTQNDKTHILIYAPSPPPYAGPEVASQMLLQAFKSESVKLWHVQSNVRNENAKKGVFDLEKIKNFMKVYKRFLSTLLRSKVVKVYFLLSSGKIGLLRDNEA